MKVSKKDNPPKWPGMIIEKYCGESTAEDLIGDIEELYFKNISIMARSKAQFKYCLQAMSLLFSYAASTRRKKRAINNGSTQNTYAMYKNYFKVAFRSLSKQKFFSIINIIGLSAGMSVGLLAVASYIDIITVDDFHSNKERIFRVISKSEQFRDQPADTKWASVPEPMSYELAQGHQGIEQVIRFNKSLNGMVSNAVEDIPIYGYYTDANFFKVFGYTLSSGNPNTALKDPYSIVISKKTSEKFFHGKEAIGEEMELIGRGTFKVTGVLNESPRSHLLFEALASYSTVPLLMREKNMSDWYDLTASYTYLLLDNINSVDAINQSLDQLPERVYQGDKIDYATFELQSMSSIPLGEVNNEIGVQWGWLIIILFFAIALLILTPACFNYANLSISRALKRSKEIGLRKVVGGQKSQIFAQFLLESCLITFVSLIGAIVLFIVSRETFIGMLVNGREAFDLELDFWTVIGFIIFSLIAGGLAGIAPALYFSRLSPLATLRASSTPSRMKKFNVRKILIVGQFALSLFFIMGIAIILKQYKYALNYNYGFAKENILDVRLHGVNPFQLKTELEKIPEISNISFSSHIAGTHEIRAAFVALPEISDSTIVYQMFVDQGYISNMNIELLAGQNLPDLATQEETFIIVNEKFLQKFQIDTPIDALNRQFVVDGKDLTVIGVVKNFNFRALREDIDAFFFRYDPERFGYANLRIASNDIASTIGKIDASWKLVAEGRKFESAFMEDELEEALLSFQSVIRIFGGLGFLSIVISCLGLLGMVVFTVENKMKEIGVKKVIGATVTQLLTVLSADFLKLLVYAAIITVPIAYFAFDGLFLRMQHFRANIGVLEILGSIIILFTIGLLTVLSQTYKAARANPVDTLRYE